MSGEMFLFVFFGFIVLICIVVAVVVASTVASSVAGIVDDEDGEEE